MKKCSTCGVEKPLRSFGRRGNSLRGVCNGCRAAQNRRGGYARKYQALRPERHRSAVARYHARKPEEHRAKTAVRRALKKGTLARMPCEVCGEPRTEAHHDDYSKPLEVRWLCKTHHEQVHHNQ